MSLRIDDVTLVDPGPDGATVVQGATVYLEEGRIAEIGSARPEAERVIDGTGCILAPGLVNAHTHAPMTLLRGAADDLPLEAWLRERIWPAEARLTAQAVRTGAELAIAEMLAGGTVGFADMYFFEREVAAAAAAAGIRCLAGTTLADAGTPEHGPDAMVEAADAFLSDWPPVTHGPVGGSVAPHAAYTCCGETLAAAAELAERHGAVLQTHCGETRKSLYQVEAETGRREVAQLAEHGCLTQATVLAHCGWITKAEVQQIAEAGATVVHNPTANMKLATGGYAPVPELLAAGVPVALGTDGPASNNRLDMFEAMKAAALLHKHHRWEAEVLPAWQVLRMATGHGAQVVHRGREGPGLRPGLDGRLVEGALADVMLVDARAPHMQPVHDPVSQLVYAALPSDVRTTIVDGRVLYHDEGFETLDVAAVTREARALARGLVDGQG